MSNSQILPQRILINSPPSGCPHVLAKAIELFGYEDYAIASNYVTGTPKSFNYKQTKNSLKHLPPNADRQLTGKAIGLGGLRPYPVDSAIVKSWLDRLAEGQYILGHIPYTPALTHLLKALNYSYLLIMSDPRSLAVSMLSFILDEKRPAQHFLQDDFKLMSPMERLNFILEGGTGTRSGIKIQSFAEVYRNMLAWNQDSNCLLIKIEDLLDSAQQPATMQKIAAYLGAVYEEKTIDKLAKINVSAASVFQTGMRQTLIDREMSDRLTEYCQVLCQESGY